MDAKQFFLFTCPHGTAPGPYRSFQTFVVTSFGTELSKMDKGKWIRTPRRQNATV